MSSTFPFEPGSSLPEADVLQLALRAAFIELAHGRAVEPPQDVVILPGGGDVITYRAVVGDPGYMAVKLSPYLPQPDGSALVSAWTVLLDLSTGQPVAVVDSKSLTRERTAATTAIAVDLLARPDARRLAVIGAGDLASAHIRHAQIVREFEEICVFSRRGSDDPRIAAMGPGVHAEDCVEIAIADADVVMLCTSAAGPVIDVTTVAAGTLVTSISTNALRAHEISPSSLAELDVYCDYTPSAVATAGEMLIATEQGCWDTASVRGDLPTLLTGTAPRPLGDRPVFFRSVGLGIEDAVVALAAINTAEKETS